MYVTVPSDLVPFVDELVAHGTYASPEDVVRNALTNMRDRQARFDALKGSMDEAVAELDRGGGKPLDFDEIKRQGRERLATYRRK
jgi:putative addiction module CopG family antidote